eukprot:431027-Prymnesium_polylepis.2
MPRSNLGIPSESEDPRYGILASDRFFSRCESAGATCKGGCHGVHQVHFRPSTVLEGLTPGLALTLFRGD